MTIAEKKKIIIQDIQSSFQNSKAVIFYNFHQLKNEKIFQLKKELKKSGGFWKIYKNSLVKKALSSYCLPLKQNNAFVFCHEDEYKPLAILSQFNEEYSAIKRLQGGIYNQNIVDGIILEKWADLPSKEVLISNLCYCLNWHLQRLVKVLEKVAIANAEKFQ